MAGYKVMYIINSQVEFLVRFTHLTHCITEDRGISAELFT